MESSEATYSDSESDALSEESSEEEEDNKIIPMINEATRYEDEEES